MEKRWKWNDSTRSQREADLIANAFAASVDRQLEDFGKSMSRYMLGLKAVPSHWLVYSMGSE